MIIELRSQNLRMQIDDQRIAYISHSYTSPSLFLLFTYTDSIVHEPFLKYLFEPLPKINMTVTFKLAITFLHLANFKTKTTQFPFSFLYSSTAKEEKAF